MHFSSLKTGRRHTEYSIQDCHNISIKGLRRSKRRKDGTSVVETQDIDFVWKLDEVLTEVEGNAVVEDRAVVIERHALPDIGEFDFALSGRYDS